MLFDSSIRKELARSFGATLVVLVTVVMTMLLIRTVGLASRGSVDPADVGTAYGMEMRLDARNDTSAAAGRGGLHDKREAAGTHAPPRMT